MWIWALLLIAAVVLADSAWVALSAIGVATVLVIARRDSSPWGGSYWIALRIGAVILVIRAAVGVLIEFLFQEERFSQSQSSICPLGCQGLDWVERSR